MTKTNQHIVQALSRSSSTVVNFGEACPCGDSVALLSFWFGSRLCGNTVLVIETVFCHFGEGESMPMPKLYFCLVNCVCTPTEICIVPRPKLYSHTKLGFHHENPTVQNPQNGLGGSNQSTHRATTQDKKSIILLFSGTFERRDQSNIIEFAPP